MSLNFLFLARVPIGQVLHVSFQKFEMSFKAYVQNYITMNMQLLDLIFFFLKLMENVVRKVMYCIFNG